MMPDEHEPPARHLRIVRVSDEKPATPRTVRRKWGEVLRRVDAERAAGAKGGGNDRAR
jgi:hypothetical protein